MLALFTHAGRGLLVVLASATIAMVILARLAPQSAEQPTTLAASSTPTPQTITLRGQLIEDAEPVAGCGVLEIWTILDFALAPDPKVPRADEADVSRLSVAVPCVELPRTADVGNAGILVKGGHYLLTVSAPEASGKWGNTVAFPAVRIDDAPSL